MASTLQAAPLNQGNSWFAWDRSLSTKVYHNLGQHVPRKYLMLLEHSGNGLVWLFAAITLLLVPATSPAQRTAIINFLVAFVVDLVLVGTLKSIFRRPRPIYNAAGDFILVVSVDQYSFPSGHASRASFVAIFVCLYAAQQSTALCCLACLWGAATAASRAIMGRHYIGDICAGIPLGILTIAIVTQGQFRPNGFLLDQKLCQDLYSRMQRYLP